MKRKNPNITVFIILTILLAVTAAASAQPADTVAWIDQYIDNQARAVDDYYDNQIAQVRASAEADLRLLQVSDFIGVESVAARAEQIETILNIDKFRFDPFYHPDIIIDWPNRLTRKPHRLRSNEFKSGDHLQDVLHRAPTRLAIAYTMLAEEKNRILDGVELAILDLERQRRYALNATLPTQKAKLLRHMPESQPEAAPGVVTAIVHSVTRASAMVNGRILHTGDEIGGVQVAEITPDAVKFREAANTWTQNINQQPAPFWN